MTAVRVVHLITGLTLGGAERHVESLLLHSRHDSQVLALYRDGPVGGQLRERGCRARSLGLDGAPKPRAVLAVARELRRLRPDVVHVHLLSGQGVGIPAARLARVPVVVSTEHSVMDDEVEGRPITRRLRLQYRAWERLATHTVAVSPTTAHRLGRQWGVAPCRMSVIPLGIDLAPLAFDPAARAALRAELSLAPTAQVVGAVGRLDPVKRFPVLLRALLPWLAGDDRYLVVVGDGPGRADLERLARDGGVADRVRLLGPRTDLARLLSAFDVLASPSRDETYGIAVVEAVANGLPVVYAQCPALDDVGLVAPSLVRLPERPAPGTAPGPGPATTTDAADEVDLREAVQALLTATWTPDPAAARRERVPSALTDRYDVGRRTADVDDLYVRFLGGRRAGGRDDEEAGCRHL